MAERICFLSANNTLESFKFVGRCIDLNTFRDGLVSNRKMAAGELDSSPQFPVENNAILSRSCVIFSRSIFRGDVWRTQSRGKADPPPTVS